ncbi:hypothetical protein G9P44_001244 [Scheffersomyces stipitis]|nr:hypothetical protein G9P44_001244 [Scheffersomyces stipitis]
MSEFMKESFSASESISTLQSSIGGGVNPAGNDPKVAVLDTIPQCPRSKMNELPDMEKNIESQENGKKEIQPTSDDPELNSGYAYVVLACAVFLNFCSWGNNSGFAIYFAYYSTNNVFPNASKLDYAAIGGICFGSAILFGPVINHINGLIGTKRTLMIGNICQFIALLLSSFDSTNRLWQLYLTQGLLQSFGLAFIGLPTFTVLPLWFTNKPMQKNYRIKDRMLTLSQGIATAGTGLGGLVFNLAMQKVLEKHGYRWALRVESFISIFTCTIAILMLKEKKTSKMVEFTFFDKDIFFSPGFRLLVGYIFFSMLGYVVTLYSIANWTIALGYSAKQGSIVAAMTSVGIIFGRPTIGLLCDKFGAVTVSCVVYIVMAIFTFAMWIPSRNYAEAIAFAIINGLLSGTIFVTVATVVVQTIGHRFNKLNVTFCMAFIAFGVSGILSPIIGISLRKPTLSPSQFQNCCIFIGCAYLVAAAVLATMRGYMISVREIARPEMSDKEFFAIRPKFTRYLRNVFKRQSEPV